MTIQELLTYQGIDCSKVKLVRHNISSPEIARNVELHSLETYQRIQSPTLFKGCEYVVSFLGTEGTNGVFLGCYRVTGNVPYVSAQIQESYYINDGAAPDLVFWTLERTDVLQEMVDRLVIDWGKAALSWCQNGTNHKEILYISPKLSAFAFTSYDKVLLTYEQLKHIVNNHKEHRIWEDKLSAVAGIYLITDTTTGKHYVGSASGEKKDGGIWGRWSDYVKTKHGGNKRLVKLIAADADYCRNFQFSILEVFPIKKDKHEILQYEQLYKNKMLTVQYGLNDN